MPADQIFLQKAIEVVKINFGDYTAKLYQTSFSTKSKEEILDFLNKLLTEFVGSQKASQQLESLKK